MGSTNTLNSMRREHTINLPSTLRTTKQPCTDLLDGSREEYISICLPLYEASITGDWQTAKVIFDERPELVRFAITDRYDTTLHVAASAKVTECTKYFLVNLVHRMEKEELELENKDGNNAFMVAVIGGSTIIAEIMLDKHEALLTISDSENEFPLSRSAFYGNHDMTRYLYDVYKEMNSEYVRDLDRGLILRHCVKGNMLDVALRIVNDYPETLIDRFNCWFILDALARKSRTLNGTGHYIPADTFIDLMSEQVRMISERLGKGKGQQALNLLKKVLSATIKFTQVNVDYVLKGPLNDDGEYIHGSGPLFVAAKLGNTKFLIEVIRFYPPALWMQNDDGYTIFHIAILHRHEDIYNLLYEIGSTKSTVTSLKDKCDNTILHLVGMTSKKVQLKAVSGAVPEIQRDLMWFKDVEKMLPPILREDKNKDGQTADQLFFENDTDLLSRGLKWMKDCTVVATLIITVTFAVAFSVPGGYNQDNGIPIFTHKNSFAVFIIADAISLFASSTSLLIFLSIITSHYNKRYFISGLIEWLLIGLVSLSISVVAMIVTFAASFFVLYHNRLKHVPLIISIFAVVPIFMYASLQLPLWIEMYSSKYRSRYMFNPSRRVLYCKKPKL